MNLENGKAFVHVQELEGRKVLDDRLKELKTMPEATDGTKVHFKLGVTKSFGYNSVRIDVGVELPTTQENLTTTLEKARTFVKNTLDEEADKVKKLEQK